MANKLYVSIIDDGAPVEARVREVRGKDPGLEDHLGERYAIIQIGGFDLHIRGFDDEAAQRCRDIAAAFSSAAGDLVWRVPAVLEPAPPGETGLELTGEAARAAMTASLDQIAINRDTIDAAGAALERLANHNDGGEGLPNP